MRALPLLCFAVFARGYAEVLFIETGEIIDIGKAEIFCDLADIQLRIQDQVLCFVRLDLHIERVRRGARDLLEHVREPGDGEAAHFGICFHVERRMFHVHGFDDFLKRPGRGGASRRLRISAQKDENAVEGCNAGFFEEGVLDGDLADDFIKETAQGVGRTGQTVDGFGVDIVFFQNISDICSAEMHPKYIGILLSNIGVIMFGFRQKEQDGLIRIVLAAGVLDQFALMQIDHLKVMRTVFAKGMEVLLRDQVIPAAVDRQFPTGELGTVDIGAGVVIHAGSIA